MKNLTFKKRNIIHIPRNVIDQKVREFLSDGGKIQKIEDVRRNFEQIKDMPLTSDTHADFFLMS